MTNLLIDMAQYENMEQIINLILQYHQKNNKFILFHSKLHHTSSEWKQALQFIKAVHLKNLDIHIQFDILYEKNENLDYLFDFISSFQSLDDFYNDEKIFSINWMIQSIDINDFLSNMLKKIKNDYPAYYIEHVYSVLLQTTQHLTKQIMSIQPSILLSKDIILQNEELQNPHCNLDEFYQLYDSVTNFNLDRTPTFLIHDNIKIPLIPTSFRYLILNNRPLHSDCIDCEYLKKCQKNNICYIKN